MMMTTTMTHEMEKPEDIAPGAFEIDDNDEMTGTTTTKNATSTIADGSPVRYSRSPVEAKTKSIATSSPRKPSTVLTNALKAMTESISHTTEMAVDRDRPVDNCESSSPTTFGMPDLGRAIGPHGSYRIYSREELERLESDLNIPGTHPNDDAGLDADAEEVDWEMVEISAGYRIDDAPVRVSAPPEESALQTSGSPSISTVASAPANDVTISNTTIAGTTTIKDAVSSQTEPRRTLTPTGGIASVPKRRGRPPKNAMDAGNSDGTKGPTKKQQQQRARTVNGASGKKNANRQSSVPTTTATTNFEVGSQIVPATTGPLGYSIGGVMGFGMIDGHRAVSGTVSTTMHSSLPPPPNAPSSSKNAAAVATAGSMMMMPTANAIEVQSIARTYWEKEKRSLEMDYQAKLAQLDMRVLHLNTVNSDLRSMIDGKDEEIRKHKEEERRIEAETLRSLVTNTVEKMVVLKRDHAEEIGVLEKHLENERREVDELKKTNALLKRGYDEVCQKFMNLGTEFVEHRLRTMRENTAVVSNDPSMPIEIRDKKRKRREAPTVPALPSSPSGMAFEAPPLDVKDDDDGETEDSLRGPAKRARFAEVLPTRRRIEFPSFEGAIEPDESEDGEKMTMPAALATFVESRPFAEAKTKLDRSLETMSSISPVASAPAEKPFEMSLGAPKTRGVLRVSKAFENALDEPEPAAAPAADLAVPEEKHEPYECCENCKDACLRCWDSTEHRECEFCWKTFAYEEGSLLAHASFAREGKDEGMLYYDYESFKDDYESFKADFFAKKSVLAVSI